MSWKRAVAPLVAVLAIAGAACGSPAPSGSRPEAAQSSSVSYPLHLQSAGVQVTIPRQPRRIVSLSASATQMLYAIGAGPQVVAVDKYSTHPASAPRTSLSGLQPNIEAIASYRPDLLATDSDPGGLARSMGALQVPVLILPAAKGLADTYAQIEQLGRATNHLGQARSVVGGMRARIAAIVASAPKANPPLRVYHELDQTYYSATSATFIGQIYQMFGLANIADTAGLTRNRGYPQLSSELIVSADPQLIFLADTVCCRQSALTVARRPGWSRIAAVRRGEVIGVDDALASEWGPRIVDFIALVARDVRQAQAAYASPSP